MTLSHSTLSTPPRVARFPRRLEREERVVDRVPLLQLARELELHSQIRLVF